MPTSYLWKAIPVCSDDGDVAGLGPRIVEGDVLLDH